MAERGREFIRQELSYDAYGEKMMNLFQDILDRKITR
jgi:hypothetical protein